MESEDGLDAPEELTLEQGIKQDSQIRKIQRENKIRVVQEGKERRRKWAQRKIQPKSDKDSATHFPESEETVETPILPGMLPSNIVNFLATREKQAFSSNIDQEEAVNQKPAKLKKKKKCFGQETVLLKNIPPTCCTEKSIEFLKRRKLKVPRSNSVLINSKQALRLLSTAGNLLGSG